MRKNNAQKLEEIKNHLLGFEKANTKELNSLHQGYLKRSKSVIYDLVDPDLLDNFTRQINILITTATEIETYMLHKNLLPIQGSHKIIKLFKGENTYYIGRLGNYNIVNVMSRKGSYTVGGSADVIKEAIIPWKPKIVISLGIAFGINVKKQKIGDVLISSTIVPYDKDSKIENGVLLLRDPWFPKTSTLLMNRISNMTQPSSDKFVVHVGCILTGENLLDDPKFKKMILKATQTFNIIGGEMEAYGMFKTANENQIKHCITIKGVCDWAEGKNALSDDTEENTKIKDKLQLFAAQNAVIICKKLLSEDYAFAEIGVAHCNNEAKVYELDLELVELWKKAIVVRFIKYYYGMVSPDLIHYKDIFTSKELDYLQELFRYPPETAIAAYKKEDYSSFMKENNLKKIDDINKELYEFHNSIIEIIKKHVFKANDYKTIEAYLYAVKDCFNEASGFECYYYTLLFYFNELYNDLSDEKIKEIHNNWCADYKTVKKDKFQYNHKFWNSHDFEPFIDQFERYEFIKRYSFIEFGDVLDEIEENIRLSIESDEFIDVAFQMSFFNILFSKYIHRIDERIKKYIKELEKKDFIEYRIYAQKGKMSFNNMYTAKLLYVLCKDELFINLYKSHIDRSIIWIIENQNIEGFWEAEIGQSESELLTHYRIKTTIICLLCLKQYNNTNCIYGISKAEQWLLSQKDELGIFEILLNDTSEGLFYMLLSLIALREMK